MKRVVIFGNSMFSSEIMRIIQFESTDVIIEGFTVDEEYLSVSHFNNLPVFPFERLEDCLDISQVQIILALGYSNMNYLRKQKYLDCKERGYHVGTFISKHAIVYTSEIAEGNILMPGCYVGPFCRLGISNVIRSGVVLSHHDIIGDYNWIADGAVYGGAVLQGNNCFLGLGSTVRNEISILDETFIASQACVCKSTEFQCVYMGVPARKVANVLSSDIIQKV